MTKTCSDCNIALSPENCYRKGKDRYQSYCKSCLCKRQAKRWVDRKKKVVEIMGGKCCSCGYCKSYAALDIHHLEPSLKLFDWGKLRLQKWQTIYDEIAKCILLCKNCHAEKHNPQSV